MFIVEAITRGGAVSESFDSYEEAVRRVDRFLAEELLSVPYIFQRLPDGSERAVREDLKPLQFHRVYAEVEARSDDDPPIPLEAIPDEWYAAHPETPTIREARRPKPDDEDELPPLELIDE